jgi:hypothetical protein
MLRENRLVFTWFTVNVSPDLPGEIFAGFNPIRPNGLGSEDQSPT